MLNVRTSVAAALAIALLGSAPALAQPTWKGDNGSWQNRGSNWDREDFWRGAPSDLNQRISLVQQRINLGIRDGSLTRSEARNLNTRLKSIRRDARRGYASASRRDNLQSRLDDLSREVRWQRRDGDDRYGHRGSVRGDRYSAREERFSTQYDASRYYRDEPRYAERRLSYKDEVYRGSDGRYYCKRNDGTTGLIIGAVGGGVLGNVVDGGQNRVGGMLIGGALGALLGKTIDQNSQSDVRCR